MVNVMCNPNNVVSMNHSSNFVNDQMKNNMALNFSQLESQNNTQNMDCKFLKSFC